jgi:predicted RNase H-like HicB family nuclease
MKLSIELHREADGRWIAEALELPGIPSHVGETIVNRHASRRTDA